ncbi:MAG: hypothetical protein FJ304_11505, partial [Planctomycetes bacterium]|nr:hypothetical protein [Planctomycetota bacterium]
MRHDPRPDRLARLITAFVGAVARRPRAVLVAALAFSAVAVALACARLEYHTQRNDLLSADKPCQQRWQKYTDAFGDDDDMVVVAEGTDRAAMSAALDDVAARVKERPELFDRVFHRADLRPLADRALLFLSLEEIEAVRARVERMEPLFGDFGGLAWRKLSVQSLLGTGGVALEKRAAGRELTPTERDLLALLPTVARSASASVRDPATYANVWGEPTPPAPLPEGKGEKNPARAATVSGAPKSSSPLPFREVGPGGVGSSPLTAPQYLFTPDGSLALLTCRPKKAAQSFTPAKEANAAMRAILADAGARHPNVALGLTGLPVLETDEMVLSDSDSMRASWLALTGVAVLYFVVYRGFRYPLLTVGSLLVGTVWALGWAALTVGHLNILSATFAVMLIGLGDYGVLWVAQYDERRAAGANREDALRHTAAHAGPSVVVAALGTALAFFATTFADFKAVAELGWIAGFGVLFCALACLTVVPALLVLGKPNPPAPFPEGKGAGGLGTFFLPALSSRPKLVLLVGTALLVTCAAATGHLRYDHNLLNLQARGADSVAWEHKLIDRAAGATWDAMSVARTRDEALALKAKYEELPGVAKVVEVASLVPDDQERKLPVVAAVHAKLAHLPPWGVPPAGR